MAADHNHVFGTRIFVLVLLGLSLSLAVSVPGQQRTLPHNARPQWQVAAGLAKTGKPTESLNAFKALLSDCRDRGVFPQAAAVLRQAGAVREAEQLYLFSRRPLADKNAFAWELADLYLSELRYEDAIDEMARAQPQMADAVRAKCEEIGQTAGYVPVARRFQSAWEKKNDAGWAMLAGLYLKGGDFKRARDCFEKIQKTENQKAQLKSFLLSPQMPPQDLIKLIGDYRARSGDNDPSLICLVAERSQELERWDDAVRAYRSLAARDPARATLSLAQLWLARRQPAQGLRELDNAAPYRAWPDSLAAAARILRGQCLVALDSADRARQAFAALAADSMKPAGVRQRALFLRSEIDLMAGNADEALAGYRELVKINAGADEVNDALGRIVLISECKADTMDGLKLWGRARREQARFRFGPAAELYRQLTKDLPGTALADLGWWGMAEINGEQKNFAEAIENYQQLIQTSADTSLAAQAFYQVGRLYHYRLRQEDRARQAWQDGILRFPDTSWADLMRDELAKGAVLKED
jgi:tetratricopeptide (TPR) repeat protein